MNGLSKDVPFPPYFKKYLPHKRYKGLKGGRGSAKSTSVATYFTLLSMSEKARFFCCRKTKQSMKDSSYRSIVEVIDEHGFTDYFNIGKNVIECKLTGSEFIFKGLYTHLSSIKSIEKMKYVWIEEAESISQEALDFLTPTLRLQGSELWATWNPLNEANPIQTFFEKRKDFSIVSHVNYYDNPFFPESMELERKVCEECEAPEVYNYVWLGAYKIDDARRIVLPFQDLKKCVGAHEKLRYNPQYNASSWRYMGLDVSDGGEDSSAYAIRRGSLVEKVCEIDVNDGYDIIRTIYPILSDKSLARCYYDAVGVGASISAEFSRLRNHDKLTFYPEPFKGNFKVKGAELPYIHSIKNKDYFSKLNAQAYWNVRLRMENTIRALKGEKVNLDYALFFDKSIPDTVLLELSQVSYDLDGKDRVVIDKSPGNFKSPNMGDSVVMSFARDLTNGLRA